MAVTGTITITLLLFLYYARTRWRAPLWLVTIGGGTLLLIDLLFVAANLTKVVHGAWLPLLIGIMAFTVMTTWHRGREIVTVAREEAEGPLDEFIDEIRDCRPATGARPRHGGVPQPRERDRTPGDADVRRPHPRPPQARRDRVHRNAADAPRTGIRADDRRLTRLQEGRNHLRHSELRLYGEDARDGCAAQPRPRSRPRGGSRSTTLRISCRSSSWSEVARRRWRNGVSGFSSATSYITADAAERFGLPRDRTVIMGERIEV